MGLLLNRLHSECQALLTGFNVEGKIAKDKIPALPKRVDAASKSYNAFSVSTAQLAVGQHFETLAALLSKSTPKTVLPSLQDRRKMVISSIGYFSVMKERYDVQVSSAVAGALIALRVMPPRIGTVIKSVMDSVKVRIFFLRTMHS